jgi:hypothetical protein
VKRPINTPIGIGNLEKIYITDNEIIMFKVWYKEINMFINWSIEKLSKVGKSSYDIDINNN